MGIWQHTPASKPNGTCGVVLPIPSVFSAQRLYSASPCRCAIERGEGQNFARPINGEPLRLQASPHFNRNQEGGRNQRNNNHLESPIFTRFQQGSKSGSGTMSFLTGQPATPRLKGVCLQGSPPISICNGQTPYTVGVPPAKGKGCFARSN